MRVLIIDDEEAIRRELSFLLEDEGYEVRSVSNGLNAMDMLEDMDFDIVITDLVLPDMDGMQILGRIKDERPDTIVVMITGYESVENAVEAMKTGADDYIPKPIDPEELLMKLSKSIELRKLKSENRLFHRRLELELDIARRIQQVLLPQQVPSIDGLDISTYSRPAKAVGGDYHDLIDLTENRLGVAIGDVAGKGMPASLLMANLQASLRRFVENGFSPKDVLFRVNNTLCPICQLIEEHRFITLFYCLIDVKDRKLIYCNAGHNYPILIRDNRKEIIEIAEGNGLPCGIIHDFSYEEKELQLQIGDRLVFYTDGVTEALNHNGEIFGEERLKDIILNNQVKSSNDLVNCIRDELDKFINDAEQHDDITLVIVSVYQP